MTVRLVAVPLVLATPFGSVDVIPVKPDPSPEKVVALTLPSTFKALVPGALVLMPNPPAT